MRVADGPAVRLRQRNNQHLPGEEVWLVGERRASGERKYRLSNRPTGMDRKTLAAAIKARWACEQAQRQLKEVLGLDHFEGRSWTGLHRHALMTLIAFAFLQHRPLAAAAGRGRRVDGPPTGTVGSLPAGAAPSRPHARRNHRRGLGRGSFASLVEPRAAIKRCLAEANAEPGPFVWTAGPEGVIEKVRRGHQAARSLH